MFTLVSKIIVYCWFILITNLVLALDILLLNTVV